MLNNKGYTLVELLAVFVVLGVLLAVTIPNIVGITTANRAQTYADDAKKFKNAVEYRFRGDSTIEKPQNEGDCIIANLKYVAGNEYENPPYGGEYLMDYSYVIMAKKDRQYKYYVQLIEKLPENEGYRGIKLDLITSLDGEKYQNEIDESVDVAVFQPNLSRINDFAANLNTYYTELAGNIKDEYGTKLCNVVKMVYYSD